MHLIRSLMSIEVLGVIAAFGLAIGGYYAFQLYQAATSAPSYGNDDVFEGKTWTDSDGRKFRDWVIITDPTTGKRRISTPAD